MSLDQDIISIGKKFPIISSFLSVSPFLYLNTNDLASTVFVLSGGALLDGIISHRRFNKTRKTAGKKTNLEKLLVLNNRKYKKFIKSVSQLKSLNPFNFKGIVEDKDFFSHSSILHGSGFMSKVSFQFEGNNEVSLFQKYSHKNSLLRGQIIGNLIRKNGYDFVPRNVDYGGADIGVFYEFLNGKLLGEEVDSSNFFINSNTSFLSQKVFESVFEPLWGIYSDKRFLKKKGLLKENLLAKKNVERIKKLGIGDDSFENLYSKAISSMDALACIHNDLHHWNVFTTNGGVEYIDLDNATLSIPYTDFFYCAAISDYVHSPDYDKSREKFMDKQKKLFPNVLDEQMPFEEFNFYFNFLSRYYLSSKEFNKSDELPIKEDFLVSSAYLLEKSKKALKEYSEISNNKELLNSYTNFTNQAFPGLENHLSDKPINMSHMLEKWQSSGMLKESEKNYLDSNVVKHHEKLIRTRLGSDTIATSAFGLDMVILNLFGLGVLGINYHMISNNSITMPELIQFKETLSLVTSSLTMINTLGIVAMNAREIGCSINKIYKSFKLRI